MSRRQRLRDFDTSYDDIHEISGPFPKNNKEETELMLSIQEHPEINEYIFVDNNENKGVFLRNDSDESLWYFTIYKKETNEKIIEIKMRIEYLPQCIFKFRNTLYPID